MRFSLPLALLTLAGASFAEAATVKKVVKIPAKTNLSGLCKSWKAECAKEAAAIGYGSLFMCKAVGTTSARVACVSKDFLKAGVAEQQLTVPVIKALKLTLASSGAVATTSSKVVNLVTSIDTTAPAATTTAKKDLTVKRTVTLPKGVSINALKREWKAACANAAITQANSAGYLYRAKAVGSTSATVTCVSKNYALKNAPEEQLTDYVIAELKLVVKKS